MYTRAPVLTDIQIWSFPLSLLLAATYCTGVGVCYSRRKEKKWIGVVSGRRFSTATIIALIVLLLAEGTWGLQLYHHPIFIATVLLTMLQLGLTVLEDLRRKTWVAAMSHGGLYLVMLGGLFGAPDVTDVQMKVGRTQAEHMAYTPKGEPTPLPFDLQLDTLRIDYYEDGRSPKQYTSRLKAGEEEARGAIDNGQGAMDDRRVSVTTSVNHPAWYKGWRIYQADYDHQADRKEEAEYTIVRAVRDPWLPIVYAGMLLLAAGAIGDLRRTWHSRKVLAVAVALATLFGGISLARIELGTMMPALRSLWFVPHIIVYMLAYSLLAIALVVSIAGHMHKGKMSDVELAQQLQRTASSLLLAGMLCGAVWAKEAWAQYWTWDAKECWAAATWMMTLVGAHMPKTGKRWLATVVTGVSLVAMQITWQGVNYLPAAKNSMHSYNKATSSVIADKTKAETKQQNIQP